MWVRKNMIKEKSDWVMSKWQREWIVSDYFQFGIHALPLRDNKLLLYFSHFIA